MPDAAAARTAQARSWPRPSSSWLQAQSFEPLYLILQNQLYRGEISHKGNSYPGEHPAIVGKPLWDGVKAVLTANRVERATGARARHPSLLTGMVFDEVAGERLTPTYVVKKGTRYRYYVSTSLGGGPSESQLLAVSAPPKWKLKNGDQRPAPGC
jgi:hypothetical protein